MGFFGTFICRRGPALVGVHPSISQLLTETLERNRSLRSELGGWDVRRSLLCLPGSHRPQQFWTQINRKGPGTLSSSPGSCRKSSKAAWLAPGFTTQCVFPRGALPQTRVLSIYPGMTDDLVITTPVKTFSVQLGSNQEGGVLRETRTKSKQRVSQARTKGAVGRENETIRN